MSFFSFIICKQMERKLKWKRKAVIKTIYSFDLRFCNFMSIFLTFHFFSWIIWVIYALSLLYIKLDWKDLTYGFVKFDLFQNFCECSIFLRWHFAVYLLIIWNTKLDEENICSKIIKISYWIRVKTLCTVLLKVYQNRIVTMLIKYSQRNLFAHKMHK